MEAFKVADTIREEIKRQAKAKPNDLLIHKSAKPDTICLTGVIDLYEVAKALFDR